MSDNRIGIEFRLTKGKLVKFKPYARKHWSAIPRIGDHILFDNDVMGVVENVRWESDREIKIGMPNCFVVIYCREEEKG